MLDLDLCLKHETLYFCRNKQLRGKKDYFPCSNIIYWPFGKTQSQLRPTMNMGLWIFFLWINLGATNSFQASHNNSAPIPKSRISNLEVSYLRMDVSPHPAGKISEQNRYGYQNLCCSTQFLISLFVRFICISFPRIQGRAYYVLPIIFSGNRNNNSGGSSIWETMIGSK